MPTYEYLCEKCEHEFEREQRISDPPVKTCPKCRSRRVKKLISRTSFVLKGGGWYSDLYASPKGDSKKDGDSESSSASSDSSTTQSDKKSSSDSSDSGDSGDSGDKSDKGGKGGKGKKKGSGKSKSAA
jgi:putative FmdB family regulatory protein